MNNDFDQAFLDESNGVKPQSGLDTIYHQVGEKYHLDPDFLKAWAQQESSEGKNNNPLMKIGVSLVPAPNKTGVFGVMQQDDNFRKAYGVTDKSDTGQQVDAAARFLRSKLDQGVPVDQALMAYHGGDNTKNWGERTTAYPQDVLGKYKELGHDDFTQVFNKSKSFDENFLGSVMPVEQRQEEAPRESDWNAFYNLANAGTLFQGPKIAGFLGAVKGKLSGVPMSFGEMYQQSKAHMEGAKRDYSEQNPMTSMVTDLAGSLPGVTTAMGLGQDYAIAPLAARAGALGKYLTGPTEAAVKGEGWAPWAGDVAGNTLTRASSGAIQGAEAGALLSGSSDKDFLDQLKTGAATGAVINPLLGPLASGTVNTAKNLYNRHFASDEKINELAHEKIAAAANGRPINTTPTSIVPGTNPNLAEINNDPGLSAMHRNLSTSHEYSNDFKIAADADEAARRAYVEKLTGERADVDTAEKDLKSLKPDVIWPGRKATDAAPVVKTIDNILDTFDKTRPDLTVAPERRTAVEKSLNDIRKLLVTAPAKNYPAEYSSVVDANGKPILKKAAYNIPEQYVTDPKSLYDDVRKEIGDKLDKSNLNDSAGKQSAFELMNVRDELDKSIDQGTSGNFSNWKSTYASMAKPIDAAEWLLNRGFMDTHGDVSLSKVQNAIQAHAKQVSKPGIQQAKALTDDQLDTLRTLRDDLLRRENLKLGTGVRSPVQTTSSLDHLTDRFGPEAVGAAIGETMGSAIGIPGFGSAVMGAAAGHTAASLGAKVTAKVADRTAHLFLNPSELETNYLTGGRRKMSNFNPLIPPTTYAMNRGQ